MKRNSNAVDFFGIVKKNLSKVHAKLPHETISFRFSQFYQTVTLRPCKKGDDMIRICRAHMIRPRVLSTRLRTFWQGSSLSRADSWSPRQTPDCCWTGPSPGRGRASGRRSWCASRAPCRGTWSTRCWPPRSRTSEERKVLLVTRVIAAMSKAVMLPSCPLSPTEKSFLQPILLFG